MKLSFILALIATILAFTAVVVEYVRHGTVNIVLIAAGLFVLAFGLTTRGGSGR